MNHSHVQTWNVKVFALWRMNDAEWRPSRTVRAFGSRVTCAIHPFYMIYWFYMTQWLQIHTFDSHLTIKIQCFGVQNSDLYWYENGVNMYPSPRAVATWQVETFSWTAIRAPEKKCCLGVGMFVCARDRFDQGSIWEPVTTLRLNWQKPMITSKKSREGWHKCTVAFSSQVSSLTYFRRF